MPLSDYPNVAEGPPALFHYSHIFYLMSDHQQQTNIGINWLEIYFQNMMLKI